MSDEEIIAEFIARRGVTRCPTVAVIRTTADVAAGRLADPISDQHRRRSLAAIAKIPKWKRTSGGGRPREY